MQIFVAAPTAKRFSSTTRMSHEEERVNGARIRNKPKRAPPHWLNPLVGLHFADWVSLVPTEVTMK
jgi:hypothetical protein